MMRTTLPHWVKSGIFCLCASIALWGFLYSTLETQRAGYATAQARLEARTLETLLQQYLKLAEQSESDDPLMWAIEKSRKEIEAQPEERFEIYPVASETLSMKDTYPKDSFDARKNELDYLGKYAGQGVYGYRVFVRPEYVGAFGTHTVVQARQRIVLFACATWFALWVFAALWGVVRRRDSGVPTEASNVYEHRMLLAARKFYELVVMMKEALEVTQEVKNKALELVKTAPLTAHQKEEIEALIAASNDASKIGVSLAGKSKEAIQEMTQKAPKAS